jgi:mannose-1-phosphate guanylyltransferase
MVLTAGLGTRLDPLTRLVAKPAVPVGRRTLIEHGLTWLRGQHVNDVVMNLHHRPETITGILGDGAHLGMTIRYSWERVILGSAGGPRRALSLSRADRVLIVNGDTLCRIELRPMLEFHVQSGAQVTLALMPNPAPDHYNGIVLDEQKRVCGVIPKGQATRDTWHFVGVQIADAHVFARLADGVPAETVAGIYLDMIAEQPGAVRGWPIDVPFMDVGTPRDYLRVALAHADAGDVPERLSGSVVWPDARVPADAELHDCIVAGPVVLPSGLRATGSVLVPASVVRPGEKVAVTGQVAVFPMDGPRLD